MTDGVKELVGKRQAIRFASQLIGNQAKYLHPTTHKDGVSELRKMKRLLDEVAEDDLEELNRLKRRQQPAGALR